MKRAVFFFVCAIILMPIAAAQSINTIEVLENGNAIWTIERHLPLNTQPEINEWNLFIAKGTGFYRLQRENQEFIDRIYYSVRAAEINSNRSMSIVDFNISYETKNTMSGTFGIIIFNFEWNNFSRMNSTNMFIGEAFTDAVSLSPDSVLIIKIPDGYEVVSSSPQFDKSDGNRLIWDGSNYRKFEKGGPSILLSRTSGNLSTLIMPIAILSILVISALFWIRKGNKIPEIRNNEITFEIEQNTPVEFLEDEQIINKILAKNGGQMFQWQIVKESGFSKSKISLILKKMREDGKIMTVRKGRGNIIKLIDQPALLTRSN